MPHDDLELGLATLAEHAHRTGRLSVAAAVRARGDRRRRRRYAATTALGVVAAGALGVGIATAQPSPRGPENAPPAASGSSPARTSVASSAPAAPSPTPPGPSTTSPPGPARKTSKPALKGGVLSGDREVFLFVLDQGEEVPEAVLAVLPDDDRVTVTSDYGVRALFVPVPVAPAGQQFLIKTARLRAGGEAYCWQVRDSETNPPATVHTAACDAADAKQLFRFTPLERDNQGRRTYAIDNDEDYLQYQPTGESGLVAKLHRDDQLETTFVLVDRGPAELP